MPLFVSSHFIISLKSSNEICISKSWRIHKSDFQSTKCLPDTRWFSFSRFQLKKFFAKKIVENWTIDFDFVSSFWLHMQANDIFNYFSLIFMIHQFIYSQILTLPRINTLKNSFFMHAKTKDDRFFFSGGLSNGDLRWRKHEKQYFDASFQFWSGRKNIKHKQTAD